MTWLQKISGFAIADEIDALVTRINEGITTKQLQAYIADAKVLLHLRAKFWDLTPQNSTKDPPGNLKLARSPLLRNYSLNLTRW